MAVDVLTEIVIGQPAGAVAAYAADPSNAPAWYPNISTITWEPPAAPDGSRIDVQRALPRPASRLHLRDHRLRPGRTTGHAHRPGTLPDGNHLHLAGRDDSTRMTLRTAASQPGSPGSQCPSMAIAIRHANRKDLRKLRAVLQARCTRPGAVGRPAKAARTLTVSGRMRCRQARATLVVLVLNPQARARSGKPCSSAEGPSAAPGQACRRSGGSGNDPRPDLRAAVEVACAVQAHATSIPGRIRAGLAVWPVCLHRTGAFGGAGYRSPGVLVAPARPPPASR